MKRRLEFTFEPSRPGWFTLVWLHPDERRKKHPPIKANRTRVHRRRSS